MAKKKKDVEVTDAMAEATEAVEVVEAVAEVTEAVEAKTVRKSPKITLTKGSALRMKKYAGYVDLLKAVLEDNKVYTESVIDKLINKEVR